MLCDSRALSFLGIVDRETHCFPSFSLAWIDLALYNAEALPNTPCLALHYFFGNRCQVNLVLHFQVFTQTIFTERGQQAEEPEEKGAESEKWEAEEEAEDQKGPEKEALFPLQLCKALGQICTCARQNPHKRLKIPFPHHGRPLRISVPERPEPGSAVGHVEGTSGS
ncbi:hypothetical protein H920_15408 [Fukomys damarensis]|uniref:Uncharacterized protein n=1 Tax=Fukomys damarensis TaxID=885580 RepID=A0A091CYD3_FUKDA|nr:hypothetical protein H920_15408 [Fukomys damarensis]